MYAPYAIIARTMANLAMPLARRLCCRVQDNPKSVKLTLGGSGPLATNVHLPNTDDLSVSCRASVTNVGHRSSGLMISSGRSFATRCASFVAEPPPHCTAKSPLLGTCGHRDPSPVFVGHQFVGHRIWLMFHRRRALSTATHVTRSSQPCSAHAHAELQLALRYLEVGCVMRKLIVLNTLTEQEKERNKKRLWEAEEQKKSHTTVT